MNYQIEYKLNWKSNLGNYEMLDTTVGIIINGEEGETPPKTLEKARAFVERELEIAVTRSKAITQGE